MTILVAYVSRGGATREYAEAIADVLREKYKKEVDVLDIRKGNGIDIDKYEGFVVGTGVRIQRIYREALLFLNKLEGKKVAVFLSSNEAGDEKTYNDAKVKYIDKIKKEYSDVNLVDVEAFGGRMRLLWVNVNLMNMDKARKWAEGVGKKLA